MDLGGRVTPGAVTETAVSMLDLFRHNQERLHYAKKTSHYNAVWETNESDLLIL